MSSPGGDRSSSIESAGLRRGAAASADEAFWLLFERSRDAILLLDTERTIRELNTRAERMIGRRRQQLLGSSIVELLAPSNRERSAREWRRFLGDGEYTGHRELLRGDGSEIPVEFAAVLATVDGRASAVYVMTTAASIGGEPRPAGTAGSGALTKREREVVTLIAMGLETPEIAAELHVAPTTVRAHVRNAMGKLGARTRAQLVALTLCADDAIHLPALG